ncbi:MAG: hypothetical protein JWM82_2969 [Myxococcales bacterium]|nr:hypothetical protein [Myxococcales bacterium]
MKVSGSAAVRVPMLATLALSFSAIACAGAQPPAPVTPAAMALPELAASTVDTRGCEPAGKRISVVERDAHGRPCRWRYFALVRRGHHNDRVLTCEAADRNGDGKIDARYFYDAREKLVYEQRDMDFDGRAEFVADYSRFPTKGSLVRARDVGN